MIGRSTIGGSMIGRYPWRRLEMYMM